MISSSPTVVVIPEPPLKVNTLPVVYASLEPLSAESVIVEDMVSNDSVPEPFVFKN